MIEFPFEARQSRKLGQVLKPIIPVRIVGPARAVNLLMLLDSGADLSLLPYSVGETLGLKLDITTRLPGVKCKVSVRARYPTYWVK